MAKDANGYWSGFLADAAEGDTYIFYVVGVGSTGPKRDPWARELANDPAEPFPVCGAVIRSASAYPWHDAGFRSPEFSDMVVYQLHVGTYAQRRAVAGAGSTYLDVIEKVEYLVALGINVVQPLPVTGNEDKGPTLGYDGSDYFSPDCEYGVSDPAALAGYLATINRLLAAKGFAPMTVANITPEAAQMKAMVDLLHVYGIAIVFDVVFSTTRADGAGRPIPCRRRWIRAGCCTATITASISGIARRRPGPNGQICDNNQSLYFTDQGFVGGLSFALWNADVVGFLQGNARYFLEELHADGFRADEISMLLTMEWSDGWDFVRGMTSTVHGLNPRALKNAEYWPGEYGNVPATEAVAPVASGGMGFDVVQHDGLREAIRTAIGQAAGGAGAFVEMTGIAMSLWPTNFAHAWQTVPCVENHDIVKVGTSLRIPALADGSNARSWYARSRSRVATALLLTAPGIPQIFMGQEFLEQKQWGADFTDPNELIGWGGLAAGANGKSADPAMGDFLRFTQDAVRLRNSQPALRGDGLNVFFTSDADRVIAFQRWVVGAGQDCVVVATLRESTWWGYRIGFPSAGRWVEVFNSDVYDNWVNPQVAGNDGGVTAEWIPAQGMPASANVVIPANGVVVFARG